ncbi:Potassium voltage-gated channel protein Shaw [Hondaea fermentalgiana]|uniref:Potassium voltage-gated channel protein Shaw n=1 Tax=Hondaea fermentalgiana TaxID=2315210 RepID=A0A2R5G4J9_9STRA|nr:Potassium voltage-gated channel protein Shaw [Hondaea fermentalgiana]|eukprot:GBG25239.1 Potassium voltage-gated channel protein Shaw [Hondaea fermentalgiana]
MPPLVDRNRQPTRARVRLRQRLEEDAWVRGSIAFKQAPIDIDRTLAHIDQHTKSTFSRLFAKADHDKTGSVTVEEIFSLRQVLGIETESIIEMEDWVALVDVERDGEIQEKEFVVFMHLARQGGSLENVFFHKNRGPRRKLKLSCAQTREVLIATLEDPGSSPAAGALSVANILLVLASVTSYCMETVPHVATWDGAQRAFRIVELVSVSCFTVELLLRFLCSRERLRFMRTPLNIIDLAAILPFYLDLVLADRIGSPQALRVARLMRVARVFKLSRYMGWMRLYVNAFTNAIFPLSLGFLAACVHVIIIAGLIFFAERGVFDGTAYVDAQGVRRDFQSLFDGMYWSVITMTTVGYGDVTPESTLGRIVGVAALIIGVLILALPVSIFTTHFEVEYVELVKLRKRHQQRAREKQRKRALPALSAMPSEGFLGTRVQNSARVVIKGSAPKTGQAEDSSSLKALMREDLEPANALVEGLRALDDQGISSLRERSQLREAILQRQLQRVIDSRREKLWHDVRMLERKFREELVSGMLGRYSSWFVRSDEELEADILQAVLRIQRVVRGGLARLVYSSKLVAFKEQAHRHLQQDMKSSEPRVAAQTAEGGTRAPQM